MYCTSSSLNVVLKLGVPSSQLVEETTCLGLASPDRLNMNRPRAGSGVVRIDPLHFLVGCCKRRLNQALSVLSLSLKLNINYSVNILIECLRILIDCSQLSKTYCNVLFGSSTRDRRRAQHIYRWTFSADENHNIKCDVHDDLG